MCALVSFDCNDANGLSLASPANADVKRKSVNSYFLAHMRTQMNKHPYSCFNNTFSNMLTHVLEPLLDSVEPLFVSHGPSDRKMPLLKKR
eukprot:m.37683 g.37683  ORF g.37683 m.37683 type:complete len:90 (-) comp10147_c0_seq9:2726-2995(-)